MATRQAELDAMRRAVELSRTALGSTSPNPPVGAVVLAADGEVVGEGWTRPPGGPHAEVVALREAGAALGSWRLGGCTLVVTLEPCAMCAGAAVLSRVDGIVFGAWDPKAGACGSVWDLPRDRRALHRPEVVGGILEEECGRLLLDFFGQRRGG